MDLDELLAREQIRQTLAAYHIAGDGDDPDGFAAVFTDDGVLESSTFKISGRQAILEWKSNSKVFVSAAGSAAAFRRHHLTTTSIALQSPEIALVRAYWTVITDIGPDHSGYYSDVFARIEGQWLIKRRQATTLWRAPNSYIAASLLSVAPKKQ